MNKFKDMLKYLRLSAGLSQRELAQKIGTSNSTIAMYESGKRHPRPEEEEALADFFNVSLDVLRGIDTEYEQDPFLIELGTVTTDMSDTGKERILAYAKEIANIYRKEQP